MQKDKLTILFATYPMAFHTPGGGEYQLLQYKTNLEALGHKVDFFNLWNPNLHDYDLVHYFSCVGGSEHFCNFIRSQNIPLAVTSSLWITAETKEQYDIEMIQYQLSCAHVVITNSAMESETLSTNLDLPIGKFEHVHNAVDERFFSETYSPNFINKFGIDGKYILNVANIEPRKNQKRLIEALSAFPDYTLVLAGHIRDQAYFHTCDISNNSQVNYIGPLSQNSDELHAAYQNASLFCLPSLLETPGIAALEAAAVGIPVVITSEGSTFEYFGDKAYYVDHTSIDNIAETIDSALRSKIHQTQKPLTWRDATTDLLDIYRNLLKITS